MVSQPHPDHLAFRSVEATLSEHVGQNHPIARHRLPFSFNVEDQYSQITPPRKTQGGHQLGQPSTTEKRNVQPQIDDPPRGDPSTERVHQAIRGIDLPGSLQGDRHGERKPSISSHLPLPQVLQKASANPTPPNAPSDQAPAPPKRLNTGIKTNAEVDPPGRGSSGQAASGEQSSAPGPDEANDSGRGQWGSNTGAPGANAPNDVSAHSLARAMVSRGGSSQVPPGSKEAELKLDSRIFPNSPSDTAARAAVSSRGRSSQVPPSLVPASLGPDPLSGSDPLRVGVASPPTSRPQDSAATPRVNQGINPSIPTYASVQNVNPHVPLDGHSPLSSQCRTHATESSLNTVPIFGPQGMGGA